MISFVDGPAAGVTLALRRAPVLLRVVRDPLKPKVWDALDQLDDEPGPGEEIFVYRKARDLGGARLCVRGKGRGASGFYPIAEYAHVPDAPVSELFDTDRWYAWAQRADAGTCPETTTVSADGAPLGMVRCSGVTGHRGWHRLLSDDRDGRVLLAWENANDPSAKPPAEIEQVAAAQLARRST